MKTKFLLLVWVFQWFIISKSFAQSEWKWAYGVSSGFNSQNSTQFVRTDAQNNAYFLGSALGYAKIGTDSIPLPNNFCSFIAKYNSKGDYLGLILPPRPKMNFSTFVISNNHIYFSVGFKDTIFKPGTAYDLHPGKGGLAVYKYTLTGTYVGHFTSAVCNNNGNAAIAYHMAADGNGALVIVGNSSLNNASTDTLWFGSLYKFGYNKGVGGTFDFMVKVNDNGSHLWLKTTTFTVNAAIENSIRSKCLTIDRNNNVIYTFSTTGSVNIDPDTAWNRFGANAFKKNIFVWKINNNGNTVFLKQFGSNLTSSTANNLIDKANGVAVDAGNNIYVTGSIGAVCYFGSDSILPKASGVSNYYLAKLNPSGTLLWAKQADSTGDNTNAWVVETQGNILWIAGTHSKRIKIGNTTIDRIGNNDAFIAKYDLNGNALTAGGCHTGDKEFIHSIAIDTSENVYVCGLYKFSAFPNAGLALKPGNIVMPQAPVNGTLFWAMFGTGNTVPVIQTPKAPQNLVATANSATQISLTWTDSSNNETKFIIERSLNASTWMVIDSVTANQTSYVNNGLSQNTLYYYRIKAANADGFSPYSNTDTATTHPPISNPTAPLAPSGLTATALQKKAGNAKILLSFTDNANNEKGFKIERSEDNISFAPIAQLDSNVLTYLDSGLNYTKQYYYRVLAFNDVGNSPYSNTAQTTTLSNALNENSIEIQVKVYPNPTPNLLTIEGEQNMDVYLFTINGLLLHKIEKAPSKVEMKMEDLPPGFYFLKILKDEKSSSIKIIKTN